ncbi:MAG: hypothetical protein HEQ10_17220 [Dolichospermum sp. DEX182a]|jgi:hypothetical protein|nr:hypothetical protein [Dolichospermum sp. DEX182a]
MAIQNAPYPYEVGEQTVVTWVPLEHPSTTEPSLVKPENKEPTFIAEVTEVKEREIWAIKIIKMLSPHGLQHFEVGQMVNHNEFNFAFFDFEKLIN